MAARCKLKTSQQSGVCLYLTQLWEELGLWGRDPMALPLRLRAMRRRFAAL